MKIFGFEIGSRHIAFVLLFSALGLLAFQFNFSEILGAEPSKKFTFFQFIGPIAGGILGPVAGIATILLVSVSDFILTGEALSLTVVVSFFTMSFAAIYFGTKGRLSSAIALGCMGLFLIHPIGSQAWFYPLFWLIPIVASYYKQNIVARSLGTTFTAHAVGSVAYLYAFQIPVETWSFLMFSGLVVYERLLFAAGIAISYYAVNTALGAFSHKMDFSFLNIEKKYALWRA